LYLSKYRFISSNIIQIFGNDCLRNFGSTFLLHVLPLTWLHGTELFFMAFWAVTPCSLVGWYISEAHGASVVELWGWRQHMPLKCWYQFTSLHGVASQKTTVWEIAALEIATMYQLTVARLIREIPLHVWNLMVYYCVLVRPLLDPNPEPYKSSPSPLTLFLRPILIPSHLCFSRDSSVGIDSGYGLDDLGVGVCVLVG
jgi:hypothetical protein